MTTTAQFYPTEYFQRQDNRDDGQFYSIPRKVVHIDEEAIRALSNLYGDILPIGGDYLDLMSSWRSHIPTEDLEPGRICGLGMNSEEMLDNPHLMPDDIWIQDLNADPTLPFAEGEFDAVLCAVSVQYLTHPIEIFAEVNRVLRPGGLFVLSFSNRCFPTKATAVWLNSGDTQHIELVASYFVNSGGWDAPQVRIKQGHGSDPLYMIWAAKADPLAS